MKILITGMNKNQCTEDFYLRQQLKVIPSHYSLIRCLRDMGHTVEQRVVQLGENISEYDRVIVFLAGPRQLVAVTFYNGLYAIAASRPDQLVLAFDDWQTKGIFDGIAVCKDPQKLFAQFILDVNSVKLEDVSGYAAMFNDGIDIITSNASPVLLSCFHGGDPTLLIDYPRDKIFTYNPNPYHHNRVPGNRGDTPKTSIGLEAFLDDDGPDDFVLPEQKIRQFNFASLVQSKTKSWLKKQKVTWPVEYFGSKKDGQRRLTEGEMVRVYMEQWGCLMPGYDHAGSGWWRARPLQVADAGSILIGDPKEMVIYYGNDPVAFLKAGDIENLSTKELTDIASQQKKLLYKHHPLDKMVQQSELKRALNLP